MISCIAVFAGSTLQCSQCSSSVSYEDCQNKLKVGNCTGPNDVCFQADVKYEKGSEKVHNFAKGCLSKELCDDYEKGDIGECVTRKAQEYEVDCKAKCCEGDECNEGNILPKNKGSAFIISVMVLLSGLLLTLASIN